MDYGKLSTQELIDRCIARDERAWEEFLCLFGKHLDRTCAMWIRRHGRQSSKDLIEELKQNTYLRLCQNDCRALRSYQGTHERSIYSFLAKTVSWVVPDYYRDEGNRLEPAELDPDLPSPDSMKNLGLIREVFECLDRTVGEEPEGKRNIAMLKLFYWHGYSAREIAELCGLQTRKVENILLRLISILRRNMNPGRK